MGNSDSKPIQIIKENPLELFYEGRDKYVCGEKKLINDDNKASYKVYQINYTDTSSRIKNYTFSGEINAHICNKDLGESKGSPDMSGSKSAGPGSKLTIDDYLESTGADVDVRYESEKQNKNRFGSNTYNQPIFNGFDLENSRLPDNGGFDGAKNNLPNIKYETITDLVELNILKPSNYKAIKISADTQSCWVRVIILIIIEFLFNNKNEINKFLQKLLPDDIIEYLEHITEHSEKYDPEDNRKTQIREFLEYYTDNYKYIIAFFSKIRTLNKTDIYNEFEYIYTDNLIVRFIRHFVHAISWIKNYSKNMIEHGNQINNKDFRIIVNNKPWADAKPAQGSPTDIKYVLDYFEIKSYAIINLKPELIWSKKDNNNIHNPDHGKISEIHHYYLGRIDIKNIKEYLSDDKLFYGYDSNGGNPSVIILGDTTHFSGLLYSPK